MFSKCNFSFMNKHSIIFVARKFNKNFHKYLQIKYLKPKEIMCEYISCPTIEHIFLGMNILVNVYLNIFKYPNIGYTL